jgi:hypothetical protein
LPGIVWTPFTHRSTATGTNETGRAAVGALSGQPAQAGWPGVTGPPLTVGTGVADPDGPAGADGRAEAADADGRAEVEGDAGDAVDAPVADAVGVDPLDGAPACVVPHPAASAPAESSTAVTANARVPGRRAAAIGAFGVLMAVPRFSGHHLDGARAAGGFTRSRVLPHIAPPARLKHGLLRTERYEASVSSQEQPDL